MTPGTETDQYAALLVETRPRSITTDGEAQAVQDLIDGLVDKTESLTEAEGELLSLLGDLLSAWEGDRYDPEPTTPVQRLRALLEDNDMRQVDLVGPVFPNKAVASEVLSGKRRLTYDHVQRLAGFFRVPADLFFPSPDNPTCEKSATRA
jgi:HTH-type transcriptional regulator / antitoxin HigA